MKITKKAEGKSLLLALEGELNTNTAPELEAALNPEIDASENVIIDMKKLNYVTSAGLRMGDVILRNVSPVIREIFEITGFAAFLKFE